MKYVDLHVHSNASDGTLSPSEVVELALKKIWQQLLSPITIPSKVFRKL